MENNKLGIVKTGIRIAVSTLVEIFIGAATNGVLKNVKGGKAAELSAKGGGFLVGMYLGDKVSDYIIDEIDHMTQDIAELKEAAKEEEANA